MNEHKQVSILAKICTRDESGVHFTVRYRAEDLDELEAGGLIEIYRPVHSTGIAYSEEYRTVRVTCRGISLLEAHKEAHGIQDMC